MSVAEVKQIRTFEICLWWESSASNDMIADSVLALILNIEVSPASVKSLWQSCQFPLTHFTLMPSNLSDNAVAWT